MDQATDLTLKLILLTALILIIVTYVKHKIIPKPPKKYTIVTETDKYGKKLYTPEYGGFPITDIELYYNLKQYRTKEQIYRSILTTNNDLGYLKYYEDALTVIENHKKLKEPKITITNID